MNAEYLNEVLEQGNENDLIQAIGNAAKAIGHLRNILWYDVNWQ
ncbi:MAG TPA: hypothetical protein PKD85_20840 [Saprospiraceae bacterium]|nr:hypothetical protein [Saprospiraceae bacterium]